MTAATTTTGDQPAIRLPTVRLLGSLIGACAVVCGGWVLVCRITGQDAVTIMAGIWGAAIVAVCTTAGLLAITPWKPRPVSLWISIWLGQTIVRLLVTPAMAYLLYSATPNVSPIPLALAVGFTYLAAVLSEAGVIGPYMQRTAST